MCIFPERNTSNFITQYIYRHFTYYNFNIFARASLRTSTYSFDSIALLGCDCCSNIQTACSGCRIVSWIIYCWLVWYKRKTLFPAGNLRSFTSKRTGCHGPALQCRTHHMYGNSWIPSCK